MPTKNCPKCGAQHEKPGIFCSRPCANSRQFSEESRRKKSLALRGRIPACLVELRDKNSPKRKQWIQNLRETWRQKYLKLPFDQLGATHRRRRVFEEQDSACASCGLREWLNVPIVLELEHIDGNNKNNDRENLKGLCPNCHSLTKTWRGRNIKKPRVSEQKMIAALRKSKNIKQALQDLKMTPKGKNYIRAKRLLKNGGARTCT